MPVAELKTGNQQVFEQTYREWHAKIYAYFIYKTKSDDMAEELVQLTFIKLWNSKHTLKTELPIQAQLFTIARSTLLDFLRQQANHQRLKLEVTPEMQTCTQPIWEFDAHQHVHALVKSLPPVRRQVFLLNRYEGYSNPEIAMKLAISVRTVEKHISLAIKQLKAKLLPLFIFLLHYVYSHL